MPLPLSPPRALFNSYSNGTEDKSDILDTFPVSHLTTFTRRLSQDYIIVQEQLLTSVMQLETFQFKKPLQWSSR